MAITSGPMYFLGVDGGGTKTVARVLTYGDAAAGCVLGSSEAPGSNPNSVGWEAARQRIGQAVMDCLADAGLESPVNGAALAIAGCADGPTRDELLAWAANERFAEVTDVVPDTAPVLASADPGEPVIGLIAGTGSAAIARSPNGEITTLGGWGYLIDDAGSGYALGRDALRRVARDASGVRQPEKFAADCSELRERLLQLCAVDRVEQLKPAIYKSANPRATMAGLARGVLELAASGDETAAAIAEDGAIELARLVDAAARSLGAPKPEVYLAGSLLLRSAYYRRRVETSCRAVGFAGEMRLAPDGACGCASLAREAAIG